MRTIIIILGIFSIAFAIDFEDLFKDNTNIEPSKPLKHPIGLSTPPKADFTIDPFQGCRTATQCWYRERNLSWELSSCDFRISGYFESKTGKMHKEFKYEVKPTKKYEIEKECTRQPEWGRDYIDKKCYDSEIKKVESKIRNEVMPKLRQKSVFRQCMQRIGEDSPPAEFK